MADVAAGFAREPMNGAGILALGFSDRFVQGLLLTGAPILFVDLIGDRSAIGVANALHFVTWIVLGVFAGTAADRWDRPTVIRWSSWLRLGIASVGAVLAATGHLTPLTAVAVVVGLAASVVFTDTSLNAILPATFAGRRLTDINARLGVVQAVAGVLAPVVAVLCVSSAPSGMFVAVAVAAVVTLCLSLRRFGSSQADRPRTAEVPVLSLRGFSLVLARPGLRSLLVGVTILNLSGGAQLTLLPLVMLRERGLSDGIYGIAMTGQAAGVIVGSLVVARLLRRSSARWTSILAGSFGFKIVSLLCLALIPNVTGLLFGTAVNGFAIALWNTPASTLTLGLIHGSEAGTTLASFKSLAMIGTPIGAFTGGLIAAQLPGATALVSLAMFLTVGLATFARIQQGAGTDLRAVEGRLRTP